MSGSFFIVDDHDLQSIDYETPSLWFPGSDADAEDGTVTKGLTGAKASLTFTGTAIGVVGVATTVPGVDPPSIQFSLDGTAIQKTTAPNNGSQAFSFPFFSIEGLNGGAPHTLEMDVLSATQNYPFVLDYIIYLPTQGASPTASQSVVTTFLPAPSSSSNADSTSNQSSGTPVGAIVGGVVGGVAVLVATGIAIWFLCFRRRRSNRQPYIYAESAKAGDLLAQEAKPHEPQALSVAASSALNDGPITQVPAQTVSSPPTIRSQYTAPGSGFRTETGYTPSERPYSDYSSIAGMSHTPSLVLASGSTSRVTSSPNQGRSKAAEAGLLSVPPSATYHADSGIRFDANGRPAPRENILASDGIVDVPPTYSAD